ncbi:MAG: transposase [Arsenophonus sp. NC-LC2-MAG3]
MHIIIDQPDLNSNHRNRPRAPAIRQEEIVWRYIRHIPPKHFKIVRYYGFLLNYKRNTLLPKLYKALKIMIHKNLDSPF